MVPAQITRAFHVCVQPRLSDFQFLADHGIKLIVNNRCEREDLDQPASEAEEQAVIKAGMDYRHIPISSGTLTAADVGSFQHALSTATGPVLAHSKTGTRSLTIWVVGEILQGRMAPSDVIQFGKNYGFDLGFAAEWILSHKVKSAASPTQAAAAY